MREQHCKTSRRFYKHSSITAQQGIIQKPLAQTFYLQSKKPLRYLNPQSLLKTLDFSQIKSRKPQSLRKQSMLPQVIPNHKRSLKKGGYLQIWLNQALDQGIPTASPLTAINDQSLNTLKTYGLDKKMLKAKNINQQAIDNIYQKLYVYTKGLSTTFQQVKNLAQGKSELLNRPTHLTEQQQPDNGLMAIFWKAFAKIMQNETPYQTSFQLIQKGHMKTIEQLKYKIRTITQEFQKQIQLQKVQIRKLERALQMQTVKYKKIQNEFNVVESTLKLTDQTLQDQVQLRLKFQQKINHVYTSYQQIKTKYMNLVQELKMKNQFTYEQVTAQRSLKQQLLQQKILTQQINCLLNTYKQKNSHLQQQIVVLKQQLQQQQQQLLASKQNFIKQSDQISQQMTKNRMMQTLLQSSGIQNKRLTQIIQEQRLLNLKLQSRISELSDFNNKLYTNKLLITQQNQNHIETIKRLNTKLKQAEQNTNKINNQLKQNNSQLDHNKHLFMLQKQKTNDLQQKLNIKNNLLQATNRALQNLKEIKDRHIRLYQISQRQRKLVQAHNIELSGKACINQKQIRTLMNQIQDYKIQIMTINSKALKTKQLMHKKQLEQQHQISKKQKSIVMQMNTLKQLQGQLSLRQLDIRGLSCQLNQKQSVILQQKSQNLYYISTHQTIQSQLIQTKKQLDMHVDKNNQAHMKQFGLEGKIGQVAEQLRRKNQQIQIQVQGTKKIKEYYKKMYQQRKQYVHPMINDDITQQFNRLQYKYMQRESLFITLKDKSQQLSNKNCILELQLKKQKQYTKSLSQQVIQLKLTSDQLNHQNKKFNQQLNNEIKRSLVFQSSEKQFKQNNIYLNQQIARINMQLKQSNEKTDFLKKQIQTSNLNHLNSQKQRNQQKNKNDNLQKQINQLKDQINILSQNNKSKKTTQKYIQKRITYDKQTQSQNKTIINQKSTQTKIQQEYQPLIEQLNNEIQQKQAQLINPLIGDEIEQTRSSSPKNKGVILQQKKVQRKDFKRALRLTFMRT